MKALEKLEILENYFKENDQISTAMLTSMKIYPYMIQNLLEDKVLVKVSRGFYKKYGEEERSQEVVCEDVIDEVDSTKESIIEISPYEFEQLLFEGKYQEAASFHVSLDKLSLQEKGSFSLYYFLLSQLFKLSSDKNKLVQELTVKDIRLTNEYYNSEDNKIRLSIFNKRFTLALKQIREKYYDLCDIDRFDKILFEMLEEMAIRQQKDRVVEIQMQENHQYFELKKFLEEKVALDSNETILLQLVNLICSDEKVSHTNLDCYSVFEGIKVGNYQKALELDEVYAKTNNLSSNQRLLTCALQEINQKLKNQRAGKLPKKVEEIVVQDIPDNISEDLPEEKIEEVSANEVISKEEIPSGVIIPQILKALWEGNLERVPLLLEAYLNEQGKSEYLFFLLDLLQLGNVKNDLYYKDFCDTLVQVDKGDYSYPFTSYLLSFTSIVEENPEEAEVYLNILERADVFGIDFDLTSKLSKKLKKVKGSSIKK